MIGFRKKFVMATLAMTVCLGLMAGCGSDSSSAPTKATLLYTSDAHYGIKRPAAYAFNGYSNAQQVNSAMVSVMNNMPTVSIPSDNEVGAGTVIGSIDFVVQGGDIANRMQADPAGTGYALVQSAYDSWKQFEAGFVNTLKFPTLLFPGNHDVSNAIGYYNGGAANKILNNGSGPNTFDGSVLAFIYNKFVSNKYDTSSKASAQASYTQSTYLANSSSNQTKIYYSRDIAGVHFMFISMWPDTDAQAWMDADLAKIGPNVPAVIMTHDEPKTETKHLTDAAGSSSWGNKFENLLANVAATSSTSTSDTIAAQRTFVSFLKRHMNVVAYFHGNTNYNQFTTYPGPDGNVSLPVFRVDSPMKGMVSGTDASTTVGCDATGAAPETTPACVNTDKLSFQVISVDGAAQKMTVREYFWKTKAWGAVKSIPLTPRSL